MGTQMVVRPRANLRTEREQLRGLLVRTAFFSAVRKPAHFT